MDSSTPAQAAVAKPHGGSKFSTRIGAFSVKKDNHTLCWIAICLWNLIIGLDCTSIATALPTVAKDLSASSNETFWTGTAFLLSSAILQPFFTTLSNAVGRKAVTNISLLLFAVGALICALSQDVIAMLVGRCIQGAGAGGLLSLTYVLMADLTAIEHRANKMSLLGLIWTVATCLGPVLGGAVTQKATWRWVFWINLPICFVCSLFVSFGLTGSFAGVDHVGRRLRRLDWIGSISFIVCLTTFLVALSWGGTMFQWTNVATLVPLIGGAIGLVAWVLYEVYVPLSPMIPIVPIMTYRTAVVNYLGTMVMGIAMYTMIYFLPLYFQAVKGYTPIISGVGILPIAGMAGPFAAVSGRLIDRTGRVKPFNVVGWFTFAFGLSLYTLLKPETTVAQWVFILAPSGMGLGMLYCPLSLATQNCFENNPELDKQCSKEEIASLAITAAGLNPFFRSIGQALGITIAQTTFSNQLQHLLHNANGSVDAASFAATLDALYDKGFSASYEIKAVFTDALRPAWWIVFSLALFWILPTLLFTVENGKRKADPSADDVELADLDNSRRHSLSTERSKGSTNAAATE